jgi:predicted hydrocarbon binding protein
MKGAIFIGFSEYVECKFGLTTWLKVVDGCTLASNGEYLSTELYDDSELTTLVQQTSLLTGIDQENITRNFGHYFFPTLMSIAKQHVTEITTLVDFLVAVDNVIHIEVKKADPLAYTPTLFYDKPSSNVLIMRYISKRKMCHFAEGLILGAADHFNQPVILSQLECMCKGDKHCLIKIEQTPH